MKLSIPILFIIISSLAVGCEPADKMQEDKFSGLVQFDGLKLGNYTEIENDFKNWTSTLKNVSVDKLTHEGEEFWIVSTWGGSGLRVTSVAIFQVTETPTKNKRMIQNVAGAICSSKGSIRSRISKALDGIELFSFDDGVEAIYLKYCFS